AAFLERRAELRDRLSQPALAAIRSEVDRLWALRSTLPKSALGKALTYLDHRGVVHRDIKPGNILITDDGTVKIIDLGLAKLHRGMTEDSAAGVTVGTVEYLSPEQARGLPDLDIRADIYSLGVTLYHMLTGEVPFTGETAEEVIIKQVKQSLDAAVLKSRGASPFVHFLLQKMMAKDHADRFQHPTEVIKEILDQAGDVTDAVRPPKKKFDIGGAPKEGTRAEGKGRVRRGRRPSSGRKPGRRRRK
ncbi:MAG: protein kinase, partial [Planctomycetota bacterium]